MESFPLVCINSRFLNINPKIPPLLCFSFISSKRTHLLISRRRQHPFAHNHLCSTSPFKFSISTLIASFDHKMTIPNLYLAAKMACPWYWYESYKNRDLHNIQKLYYSTVPLPGIYAITAHRRHYLVAIRPIKGKQDTEHIFEPGRKTYDDKTLRSKIDRINAVLPHQKSPF